MYIYITTNLLNNKVYIGQSRKCSKDTKGYYGSGKLIKAAIKKYGKENFSKYILIDNVESLNKLHSLEILFIKTYKDIYKHKCYNLATGGEGGNTHHYATLEEKKAFSEKCQN